MAVLLAVLLMLVQQILAVAVVEVVVAVVMAVLASLLFATQTHITLHRLQLAHPQLLWLVDTVFTNGRVLGQLHSEVIYGTFCTT